MYKNLRWKFLIIAIVTGLSIWSFVPPSTKVRLGLDLKGGIHLVMRVHTDDALRLETETVGEQLQQALAEAKMTVTVKPGLSEFVVEGVPPAPRSNASSSLRACTCSGCGRTWPCSAGRKR